MKPWELRQYLSSHYFTIIQEWVSAKQYASTNWLLVSTREILEQTEITFKKIISYIYSFDNSLQNEFHSFVQEWRQKQQYFIDEIALINKIVSYTINRSPLSWDKLNIISESMLQNKLQQKGYKINDFGLEHLPQTSIELNSLLTKL
jgi:hypothetical protein